MASIGNARPNALTEPPMSEALLAPTQSSPAHPYVAVAVKLARRHAGRWALRGVDLELEPGRALMIAGPNGSGKTTLVHLLGTALTPTSGTLQLFGGPAVAARPRVAMLSHRDNHYDDLSARENLLVSARLTAARSAGRPRSDVDTLLAHVGLAPRADDVVRTFSAGMRKRLAFARLLWKRADLVLLDEPYAGLDPAGGHLVDSLIRDWRAAGTTVVLCTHQVARGAALCDDAVLLDAGRVKWRGKAGDVPEQAGEPQE